MAPPLEGEDDADGIVLPAYNGDDEFVVAPPRKDGDVLWLARKDAIALDIPAPSGDPKNSVLIGRLLLSEMPLPDDVYQNSQLFISDVSENYIQVYVPVAYSSPWKGMNSYYCVRRVAQLPLHSSSAEIFKKEMGIKAYRPNRGLGILFHLDFESRNEGFLLKVFQKLDVIVPSICDPSAGPILRDRLMKNAPENIGILVAAMYPNLQFPVVHSKEHYMSREDFAEYFRELRPTSLSAPRYALQTSALSTTLRPYQVDAVRFMIHRELTGTVFCGPELDCLCIAPGLFYFSRCGLFALSSDNGDDFRDLRGGILAEEMGLGKTVELLALICTLRKGRRTPWVQDDTADISVCPVRATVDFLVSSVAAVIEGGRGIKEMGLARSRREKDFYYNDFAYYSSPKVSRKELLCTACGQKCASARIQLPSDFDYSTFQCPACTEKGQVVDSGSTLIVVPNAIYMQWYEEIKRHIKEEVTVDLYQGIALNGYKHPLFLAQHDIVLVSYEVLEKEVDLVEFKPREGLRKRPYERGLIPPCPLLSVNWWRICLDESQLIEGGPKKAARLCAMLSSRARWCVTGTPLQRSLSDLGGLLHFLDVGLYSIEEAWLHLLWIPYSHGEKALLLDFVRQIFWRNNKRDVMDQLGLPPCTSTATKLHFSPLEERTYQVCLDATKQHIVTELSWRGREIARDTKLNQLNARVLKVVWTNLTKIRAAIVTGNGGSLLPGLSASSCSKDDVFSPDVLFARLHIRARRQLVESQRNLIANRNGLAGLLWLYGNIEEALETYKKGWEVVRDAHSMNKKLGLACSSLEDLFDSETTETEKPLREKDVKEETEKAVIEEAKRKPISVDSLQLVHIARAMSELRVLSSAACAFYDEHNMDEYLEAAVSRFVRQSAVLYQSNRIRFRDAHVNERDKAAMWSVSFPSPNCWLPRALSIISSSEPHRESLTTVAQEMRVQLDSRLFPEKRTPFRFDDFVDKMVQMVSNAVEGVSATGEEVSELIEKCFAQGGRVVTDTLRSVMECPHYLESQMTAQQKEEMRRLAELGQAVVELTENLDTKTLLSTRCGVCRVARRVSDLRELLGGSHDASLASDSLFSFEILCAHVHRTSTRVLLDVNSSVDLGQYHQSFTSWLSSVRPLLEHSLAVVGAIQELAYRHLELETASKRVSEGMTVFAPRAVGGRMDMRVTVGPFLDESLLRAFRSADMDMVLTNSRNVALMSYLHAVNLGEAGDCPVCYSELESRWMVFPCAHSLCVDCWKRLKKNNGERIVHCVTCRARAAKDAVAEVVKQKPHPVASDGNPIPGHVELSVKVAAIVMRIYEVMKADPNNKLLVFSSLTPVLQALCHAFESCTLPFVHLGSNGAKRDQNLNRFKSQHDVRICLMNLSSGANGLNLTEANHIIFAEPFIETSVEAQAVGRIDRFGQTRPISVHHFVVGNSIEEEIYRIASNSMSEECWTLGTLKDVFGIA